MNHDTIPPYDWTLLPASLDDALQRLISSVVDDIQNKMTTHSDATHIAVHRIKSICAHHAEEACLFEERRASRFWELLRLCSIHSSRIAAKCPACHKDLGEDSPDCPVRRAVVAGGSDADS